MYCFLYVLVSELLPLLAQFFFPFRWKLLQSLINLKRNLSSFSIRNKIKNRNGNFKILNELSVFVYSKKICIIKLISIFIMYSMSLTKKLWLKFFSELDLISNFFFFAESKKVKKGNYIHTNIKMVFYSILLTRPYINRKKVNVSKKINYFNDFVSASSNKLTVSKVKSVMQTDKKGSKSKTKVGSKVSSRKLKNGKGESGIYMLYVELLVVNESFMQ